MKRKKVHIYHTSNIIELNHTIFALLVCKKWRDFKFIRFNDIEDIQEGQTAVFIRIFKYRFNDLEFVDQCLHKLRNAYDRLVFMDDSAGSDSLHFEFIDKIDIYFKGKLPRDKQVYYRDLYGRQVFSDYYHRKFGVEDEQVKIRKKLEDPEHERKIHLSFNPGFGVLPKDLLARYRPLRSTMNKYNANVKLFRPIYLHALKKLKSLLKQPVDFKEKLLEVNARMTTDKFSNTIGYQRRMFHSLFEQKPGFKSGPLHFSHYQQEMKQSFATLSLFGFGEVCFRDFEAVIYGSLLIKPSMDHLITFPDIYIPHETYIPVKWDGSDLLEVTDKILSKPKDYYDIVMNARKVYLQSLERIDDYMDEMFEPVFNMVR